MKLRIPSKNPSDFRSLDGLANTLFDKAIGALKGVGGKWFDRFRWVEFSAAVGGAWEGTFVFAQHLGLSVDKAQMLASIVALGAAVMYIRNPKQASWEPAEKGDGGNE